MFRFGRKISREKKTIRAMMDIFCREKHNLRTGLCAACRGLLDYAHLRLEKCPFGENKSACADCPVHCYQPARREEIKAVMRYSGPRMMVRHPLLTFFHLTRPKPVAGSTTVEAGSKKRVAGEH